jgi:hypothetical protein
LIILKKQGFSNRKSVRLLQISRNTANSYTQIFEGGSGRNYDHLLALDDLALEGLCAPHYWKK